MPDFSGYLEGSDVLQVEYGELLKCASGFAVTPISGFKTGAIVVGQSGRLYLGANMEFTGMPLSASLHAGQSAVLNAWMHGESAIQKLILSAMPPGHCLQFLLELHGAADLCIEVNGHATSMAELMPRPLNPARSKGRSLLDSPHRKVVAAREAVSDFEQRAVNAASRSYCPYTHSPEGFVIETISGRHFVGRTAESSAYNPSVTAVVAAFNQLNLSAQRSESIVRCAYAKLATALTHSQSFSEALLRGLTSVAIEAVPMETTD